MGIVKCIHQYCALHGAIISDTVKETKEQEALHKIDPGIYRPATHPDLIGISRFPDSTCENPEFSFSFEIGKTKGRLPLLHGLCLQTHKFWAKNKCYDRLNPLHTATQPVK